MSKLPSERIGEIISEKYNPDFATERDRINAIIAYLDETAKEKECEHKDTHNEYRTESGIPTGDYKKICDECNRAV